MNIKVTKDVRRKLVDIGRISEDCGDVVESLIDFYNKNRNKPGVEDRKIREREEGEEGE